MNIKLFYLFSVVPDIFGSFGIFYYLYFYQSNYFRYSLAQFEINFSEIRFCVDLFSQLKIWLYFTRIYFRA